ncbi:beta-N-acetylhexosaminidase [Sphingomonas sp. Root241]|uniref:beta-N-acetylhexosaminidase n=1 Tax=Sphingomonas sp. Root241 TaxID=1736501 RepID=UPI000700CBB2|nr:family 20 glycosylhydrolase [Sphingomonas sp. Root241]KRC82471.1 beta-hexosaminidase [Sphingomonas sp. Root241]
MRVLGVLRLRHVGWAALLCGSSVLAQSADPLPLTPLPQSIVHGTGSITIGDGATIAVVRGDPGAAAAARVLTAHVKVERGLRLTNREGEGAITLIRDASIKGDEAYRLVVSAGGIRVSASGDRGLLYGAMTVAQLLSPDRAFGKPVKVPAVTIEDAPRFGWRGLMLDPVRHFQPIESIYAVVDQMTSVKLNTLHLHLTDDQGWRFEVKRYPKLTEIGGWRTPPSTGNAPGPKVGGFYTQEQLKALVAYAAERGITIVPEIDLPGHAQALVAAYPEFGVFGDRPEVSHDWGVNPYLFDPGPKGVAFVKEVLDEVMAVFPGTYIHLGGDEAVKDQWERSPRVQAQIKALKLKDENQLQSWMIDEFGTYLASKGRRLIGWDEILEGGLPPSASIMSWRGEKGAVEAANQNHDVVLTPAPTLYLDSLQSDRSDEPPGRLSIQTLADVYRYEPMPAGIDAEKAKHVLGAQGNAWSEYLATPYQVQHMLFPRAAAIAEITWSAKEKRDFPSFLTRLDPQIQRWRRSGVEVADSAFAVGFQLRGTRGDALRANRASVALATQAPYGTIRYTLDGKVPTAKSPVYKAPLSLKPGVAIQAAAFDAAGNSTARPRIFDTSRAALLTRTSSELIACPRGAFGLRVPLTSESTENAPVFNVNLFDTCSAYPAAPLDVAKSFTIDIARLARHYGLAHEARALRSHFNVTTYGELVISARCIAAAKDKTVKPIVVASFPLPDPKTAPTRFSFSGSLPAMAGDEDLCFQFTSPLSDPFYAVERATLSEAAK